MRSVINNLERGLEQAHTLHWIVVYDEFINRSFWCIEVTEAANTLQGNLHIYASSWVGSLSRGTLQENKEWSNLSLGAKTSRTEAHGSQERKLKLMTDLAAWIECPAELKQSVKR